MIYCNILICLVLCSSVHFFLWSVDFFLFYFFLGGLQVLILQRWKLTFIIINTHLNRISKLLPVTYTYTRLYLCSNHTTTRAQFILPHPPIFSLREVKLGADLPSRCERNASLPRWLPCREEEEEAEKRGSEEMKSEARAHERARKCGTEWGGQKEDPQTFNVMPEMKMEDGGWCEMGDDNEVHKKAHISLSDELCMHYCGEEAPWWTNAHTLKSNRLDFWVEDCPLHASLPPSPAIYFLAPPRLCWLSETEPWRKVALLWPSLV